jgi:hypothetical protein
MPVRFAMPKAKSGYVADLSSLAMLRRGAPVFEIVTGVVGALLFDGVMEATESRESNVGFNTIRSFDAELPLIIEISKLDA